MKTLLAVFFTLTSFAASQQSFLGFDRNEYPGNVNLKMLRQTFSYTGYWLNNPPGSNENSWKGKRELVEATGFGFLVLFNGRTYAQIKAKGNAAKLGAADGANAAAAARVEGFPSHTIIFLDQEEGGRLLPEQLAYLFAWIDAVSGAGFGTGVYCSGIAAPEGSGQSIVTADDIKRNAGQRRITYWVVNDSCPPSPGCTVRASTLASKSSGIQFADVWQFAQSPRRADFASNCRQTYDRDGNCYADSANIAQNAARVHLDLNLASSSDPSQGSTKH